MRQDLIGYLLDSVDEEERAEIESARQNPETAGKIEHDLAKLERALQPLERDRDVITPPIGLAERTIAAVKQASADTRPTLSESVESDPIIRPRVWLDRVILTAASLAAIILLAPLLLETMEDARATRAQQNLQKVATALQGYADVHSMYPTPPDEGPLSRAGLYAPTLVSEHRIQPDDGLLVYPGSALNRKGNFQIPSKEELAYLNPYIDLLPKEIFNTEYTNPKTDGSGFIRSELQEATKLIKDAGWKLNDGKLVNSQGDPFEFEILLVSPAFERIVLPFIDNLEKLGINASLRTIDSSQYQKRIETFDFDMVVFTFSQSLSPGNEQRNFWGSDAADTNGSRNVIGVKNDVVDSLIEKLINAKDREDLITITRALDRVLLWNYYVIPQWHISAYRVLYWDMFDQPKIKPKYSLGFDTWWINQNKFDFINSQRSSN